MEAKLSILIPTIYGREKSFSSLIEKLKGNKSWKEIKYPSLEGEWYNLECNDLPVSIFTLKDNKELSIGEKRNILMYMANGERIAYHDDDDRPEDDYIETLLEATKSGADVIAFQVSVSLNGGKPKLCYYNKDYHGDYNEPKAYYRLPNHIMCVKRELALQVKFLPVNCHEDSDYSKRLKPLLKTQHSIDKVLYHYDFNKDTTETQKK